MFSSCTNNKCKGELRRSIIAYILVLMLFQVPISTKRKKEIRLLTECDY